MLHVVVMDNLGSQKHPAIRASIEAAGASLRYLPAYSPELNPIEMAFAKPISATGLVAGIGEALEMQAAREAVPASGTQLRA